MDMRPFFYPSRIPKMPKVARFQNCALKNRDKMYKKMIFIGIATMMWSIPLYRNPRKRFSLKELQRDLLPINVLNVAENIWKFLETPVGNSVSPIEFSLAMHLVWFPIGNHAVRKSKNDNNPYSVENVFEDLAESVTV
jgi:hypothetical protein